MTKKRAPDLLAHYAPPSRDESFSYFQWHSHEARGHLTSLLASLPERDLDELILECAAAAPPVDDRRFSPADGGWVCWAYWLARPVPRVALVGFHPTMPLAFVEYIDTETGARSGVGIGECVGGDFRPLCRCVDHWSFDDVTQCPRWRRLAWPLRSAWNLARSRPQVQPQPQPQPRQRSLFGEAA